ncbi:26603_t:CDS:2 [Gigaspora margarita]|uniref:26603_t:CDS:1 n=1 Tax=Gigaspora margarita TaxID=4874 RepID=A0ABN7VMZ3_GIGMA|nr:26603_t:CDS:2 [Gigaspora margarita]
MELSKTVAKVVNRELCLAKCIRRHEHQDVVAYRQIFLEKVAQLNHFISKWFDQDYKIITFSQLSDSKKEHMWITHDESSFYAYDGPHTV